MSSTEPQTLTPEHRQILLDTARQAIANGVHHGQPLKVRAGDYPEALRPDRATFVTLREPGHQLRGCMGTSQAVRPLVEDVCRNAFSAAFLDPRFMPVGRSEVEGLSIQVSVLSPLEQIHPGSEEALLAMMRPGVDGLLIEEGPHRATLLPSVWEVLPEARVFLRELKLKAGLPPGYWALSLRVFRYTAECFP